MVRINGFIICYNEDKKRWVALLYTVMKNERLNSVQTGSGHL